MTQGWSAPRVSLTYAEIAPARAEGFFTAKTAASGHFLIVNDKPNLLAIKSMRTSQCRKLIRVKAL